MRSLPLDLSLLIFQEHCHVINDLLIKKKLKVCEVRKKFHYLIKKVLQNKNDVQRDLLACVEQRFNGSKILSKLTENERKELLKPIHIVYKPFLNLNQTINCYFSKSMRNAYQAISDLKKRKRINNGRTLLCL